MVALVLLLAAALAVFVFSTSPAFFLYSDETEYAGLSLLSPEAVWNGAAIPEGLSVFFLNPARAAAALKSLPEVQDARVTLRLPSSLTIAVTERIPEIAWTQGGATWWVDASGQVLAQAARPVENSGGITATSMDATPLQPGNQVDAVAVRSMLHYRMLLPEATRFQYARDKGISLIAPEGWPVHLGDDRDSELKITVLTYLAKDFAERGIVPVYLDLRVPEAPAYKR